MKREFGQYIFSERIGEVVRITLNRPDRLNAFAGNMRTDLLDALGAASTTETRVITITGTGRAFCAGADLHAFAAHLEAGDETAFAALVKAGTQVVRAIRSAPQLVIAAVNGAAAGAGASLAAACDLRIAADSATVGFTFVRLGLHPDWGATYTLPRIVGQARAAALVYTGRMLAAEEARSIGLFDRVVPAEVLESAAMAWAQELAGQSFAATAAAKRTLELNAGPDLAVLCDAELTAQLERFRSPEVCHRVAEFLTRSGSKSRDE